MPAYLIFDMQQVTKPELLGQYRAGVMATVKQFGGRYLDVGGQATPIEGNYKPAFSVIIEFPTAKHARDWYDSAEYKSLKSIRHEATRGTAYLLEAAPWSGESL